MLVIEPSKRIKLEELYTDKWFSEGYEEMTFDGSAPQISPELHSMVMNEMKDLGIEPSIVQKALDEGAYDSNTATYYLLADKRMNNPVSATKSTPAPTKQKKVSSKVNLLETFDEDSVQDKVSGRPPPRPLPGPPPVAQTATPPKVPPSARRRAATQTAAPTDFVPDFSNGKDVPPKVVTSPAAAEAASPPQSLPSPPAVERTAPPIPTRARAHTIQAEKKDDQIIPIDKLKAHLEGEVGAPRTARFTFSLSTTSTKDPKLVFETVKNVLVQNQVKYKEVTPGMNLHCKLNDLEFELEVCKLPNLDLVGLKCKRTNGGAWEYKELLSSLIGKMDLGN